jgi:hypothetical protein
MPLFLAGASGSDAAESRSAMLGRESMAPDQSVLQCPLLTRTERLGFPAAIPYSNIHFFL